jgi:hyaluronan synthase/N-acetylglucosaminyltransferase
MSFINIYLIVYGVVALGHIALQVLLGHLEHRRQGRLTYAGSTPRVTVVVPAYNEDPALLHRCLMSIDRQDYPEIEAIVVDDGSLNVEELLPVHDEFSRGKFRIVLQPDNRGKRNCQAVVFEHALGDIVVTIDSDTVLSHDAIRKIVRRFENPKVGAVTGNVEVINQRQNLLTRLIGYRYWMAFNQERAAQSYFGVVMCASGPFSAYRRSIIDEVRDAYVSQRFFGKNCTFGDDRHLTNLVLGLGYDVVYDEAAVARTRVPSRISDYVRQQVRWNKSFYREILWTAKFVHKRNAYMALDLSLEVIMPFALLVAVGLTIDIAITAPAELLRYAAIVGGVGLARAVYGLARTKSPGFLLFLLYGFIHVLLLVPVRLYALATIGRGGWGTRGAAGKATDDHRREIVHARSEAGRAAAELAWEQDIRESVAGESFVLYWQPIRDTRTGEITHAEILLRLIHDGIELPPAGFLNIAERHGLSAAVDEWVVEHTIALLKSDSEGEPVQLEVNLSAASIADIEFTTRLRELLSQADVSPRRLVLSIPEAAALQAPGTTAAFARRARAIGCLVAIDHVGEADDGRIDDLLLRLPVDYVKLAGSLVRPLPDSDAAQERVQLLIAQARHRGMQTVAVFVGDDQTVELLEQAHADYVQGFHIGTPEPVTTPLAEITARASSQHLALAI